MLDIEMDGYWMSVASAPPGKMMDETFAPSSGQLANNKIDVEQYACEHMTMVM